jgi:uncharacterized membrane protein
MTPQAFELLDLAIRWTHVIAGIMWVGNSLLFNWLDRILEPSPRRAEGIQGSTWLIHSGGFYSIEKTLLVGHPVPRPLHWFKWQAYTTWISGAVLLVVVYYWGGRALLVDDPAVSHRWAITVGVSAIVAAWIGYEVAWRFVAPRSLRGAEALSLTYLVALAVALPQVMSGRAAWLHVGAAIGTIMAANVAMTVMPSQRALIAAVHEGRGVDPVIADEAKTRSIHNNYLAFPVIALMLSIHFPSLYAHRLSWLLMLVVIAGGAAVRHMLNIRFTYRNWAPVLASIMIAAAVTLYALMRFGSNGGPLVRSAVVTLSTPVTFSEVRRIIDRRCAACHSTEPSDVSFGRMPGGVAFDTPEQIHTFAARIRERAVITRTMPPANSTRITEAERALLGRWAESARQLPR